MEKPVRQPATEDSIDASAITVTANPAAAATRPAPPLVVLSEDPVLLEAVSIASQDLIQVIVAPSSDRFIDQLVASGGELALIDSAAVFEHLADFLELVHHQFPQLQLLLAGPGNVQHQIGAHLTDGTVFRFVHKPASGQRLKLFLDAAMREHQTRIYERQTRLTEQILRAPLAAPSATGPARRTGFPWRQWVMVGVALLIAGAGVVIWYSSLQVHPVAASSPPASLPPAPAPPNLTPPPAAAAATHAGSPTGMTEAEHEAIDRAAAERSERSEKERLAAEAAARQEATAEATSRAQNDARLAQVRQLVDQARSRIASGALLEPADDSARTYVAAAMERAPDEQDVRAVSVALGDALINSFRRALTAGDVATASEWLKACRSYGISESGLAQMAEQLETFQAGAVAKKGAELAVESAPVTDTVSTQPPEPSPPAPPVAASGPKPVQASAETMPEGELHRLQFNPPTYPPEALMRHETGTVELDFTVTPSGTVTAVKITKADPIGVFERAAMSALSHNRYEPVQRDGQPVAQRAHIRMRFAM
jgi:TonB family protein